MKHKFYKILAINCLIDESSKIKQELFNEILVHGSDSIIFMRRFRMLRQLSDFEEQMTNKIYQFKTNDHKDYMTGINFLIKELHTIASRNA